MYETLTFTGGIHKSEELKELIEDLGGFVLQSNILQMELVLNMAVPIDDVDIVKQKAKELLGEISVAPMAGSQLLQDITFLMQHVIFLNTSDVTVLKTTWLVWLAVMERELQESVKPKRL